MTFHSFSFWLLLRKINFRDSTLSCCHSFHSVCACWNFKFITCMSLSCMSTKCKYVDIIIIPYEYKLFYFQLKVGCACCVMFGYVCAFFVSVSFGIFFFLAKWIWVSLCLSLNVLGVWLLVWQGEWFIFWLKNFKEILKFWQE